MEGLIFGILRYITLGAKENWLLTLVCRQGDL